MIDTLRLDAAVKAHPYLLGVVLRTLPSIRAEYCALGKLPHAPTLAQMAALRRITEIVSTPSPSRAAQAGPAGDVRGSSSNSPPARDVRAPLPGDF